MPEPRTLGHPNAAFDEQALNYDARAGIPASPAAAVARAVVEHGGVGADDLVVELGAGTGEIGMHFARLPLHYIGLDASPAMLDVFRDKAAPRTPALVVADCEDPWPLAAGESSVVFASRVIHLLEPGHVARETRRVCRPAGSVILGRVVRDGDGIAERLRRRRLDLLRAAGVSTRHGEGGTRHVIDGCLALGGVSCGRQVVAEWTSVTTPGAIIAGWERLPRMGSVAVDAVTRAAILDELRHWARTAFGDLERPQATAARYIIDLVRWP